jgi:hypothetical protein
MRRIRLVALPVAAALALPLTATGAIVTAAGTASADQTTDYLLANSGYTGNASDPDVEPCYFNQPGYCMYTSQDLGSGGNTANAFFPMNQTLGFWSPDGVSWTYEGVVAQESTLPSSFWSTANGGTTYPKHLWAPNAVQGPDGNFHLFDPDITDTTKPDTSSVAVISTSPSPFGPFNLAPGGHVTKLQGDPNLRGGYLSDPDVDRVGGFGGETDYMVYANGSGGNCGDLSLGVLNSSLNGWANGPGKEITINGMWGHDGFVTDNAKCTQHAYMEGPQLYNTGNWQSVSGGTHTGEPGQFILTFAASPGVMPEQCASNFGQAGTKNEVIAYATASSIDSSNPQFQYGGILMCGSASDYTDQASLMPLANGAIALVYHDGPGGTPHARKTHAQCIAYGGGAFATATRPQNIPGGAVPTFAQCANGSLFGDSVIVDPSASKFYGSGSQSYSVNNFVVSAMLNTSGYTNGELATTGRTAVGKYETFQLDDYPYPANTPTPIDPSQFPNFDSSSWSDLALVANMNNEYVTTAGNNQFWAELAKQSGGFSYYPYNVTAQWGNNVRGFQTTNVFLSLQDSAGSYGVSSPSAPGPLASNAGIKAYNILGYYGSQS